MITKKYYYESDNVNELYYAMTKDLLENGKFVPAPNKDKLGTKELENVKIVLTNPADNIITLKARKTSKKYLLAENIWYARGSNALSFIDSFASTWSRISDDGLTNNSAYGYIMRYKHGFNQIEKMIEMLMKDPTQRRAVININIPNEDIIETKDEQCTMYLQFLLRQGKLNMTACMRSNDLIFGFANDIAAFTALQLYIAHRLNVEVGTYTHFDTSLHYYLEQENIVNNIVENGVNDITDKYSIDWIKLYEDADEIYDKINKDKTNILSICREAGILDD